MLLMLEKGIGLEFAMLYIAMQKQIINSWKTVTLAKNHPTSYTSYVNNLRGWAMSQKLPVNVLKGKTIIWTSMKTSCKTMMEITTKNTPFRMNVDYLKELTRGTYSDLQFLPERIKIDNCEELVCNLHSKKNCFIGIGVVLVSLLLTLNIFHTLL